MPLASVKKAKSDAYANVAFALCTMTAADTLTFKQIQMAVGLFQGVAMVIHRIKYYPTVASLRQLVANTDQLYLAITSSNRLASISAMNDPAIIDLTQLVSIGVAVERYVLPITSDFTNMPGGGKIVAANPLWVGMMSGGFAVAAECNVQIEFTFASLSDSDYLEIIQSQFPANIS